MTKYHKFVKSKLLRYPVGENLEGAIQYIDEIIPFLKKIIGENNINIWCMGSSGVILSTLLAKSISNACKICYIRKENEHRHLSQPDNIFCKECTNIILDDFSRYGDTLRAIYKGFIARIPKGEIEVLVLANGYKDTIPDFPVKHIIIDGETAKEWKKLKK